MDKTLTFNRRDFLKTLGAGLAVTFTLTNGFSLDSDAPYLDESKLASWIHVGADGKVTVFTGKAEVGQNIRTSLAQIVAEELDHQVDAIDMIMGDTDLTPYDRGTFGSRSIPYMGPTLRKAAATAREAILQMAADQWKIDKTGLSLNNGIVTADEKKISIGKLTEGKKFIQPVNESVKVKAPDEWKIAGTSVRKINGASFVTGRHKYVSDMKVPGMLYGKVLRAPAVGATLSGVDASAAKAMKDVVVVQENDFVGIAAPTRALATKALNAIRAEWKTSQQPSRSEIFEYLKANAKNGTRDGDRTGDVSTAYSGSAIQRSAVFTVDYIAHVPLEPRAGLAEWKDGRLTVWTGTQRPFGVHEELANLFGLSKDSIRVIQPDTGSGYGGKHTGEAGIEAARLSKAAGKPVKVVWSREEEFMWAYLRPAGVIEVNGGIDKNGKLVSWEFHNYNSGPSGLESPYVSSNRKEQFHPVESPLRQGSYRGLAATANTFARECMIDDLAAGANKDALDFRLDNLKEQRLKDVLKIAADKFGWPVKALPQGHGVGLACGTEKGSFIATCAEVEVDSSSGNVKVLRVVAAFECGAIINPNHLENQIQGSVIQGLGGALFEYVDFKDGKLLNGSMSKYRVPRFSDIPQLEIVMVNRKDIPSLGAGETPILAIAPAVRNAIANATGKRLYRLPLAPDGVNV